MATEETIYVEYEEAIFVHIVLMKAVGETRYGVSSRDLIQSALARPRQAAIYENAGLIRQAATLCFGLIKNHPWQGGNKRTATVLTNEFLKRNGWQMKTSTDNLIEMVLAVEADAWRVDEIENWLRDKLEKRGSKNYE